MSKNNYISLSQVLPGLMLLFSMVVPVSAFAQVYFGYGVTQVNVGGDMDGESFLVGGGSIAILPDVSADSGSKVVLGMRSDNVAYEISYTSSDHVGTWLGAVTPVEFASLNIDIKFGSARLNKGGLYGLVGLGFDALTVVDGASDGFSVTDAKYRGLDIRLGVGAEHYLSEHLALDVQAVYRMGSYNTVDGVDFATVDSDVNGNGATLMVGMNY